MAACRLPTAACRLPTAVYRLPVAAYAVAVHQGLEHAAVCIRTSLYMHSGTG